MVTIIRIEWLKYSHLKNSISCGLIFLFLGDYCTICAFVALVAVVVVFPIIQLFWYFFFFFLNKCSFLSTATQSLTLIAFNGCDSPSRVTYFDSEHRYTMNTSPHSQTHTIFAIYIYRTGQICNELACKSHKMRICWMKAKMNVLVNLLLFGWHKKCSYPFVHELNPLILSHIICMASEREREAKVDSLQHPNCVRIW